MSKEEIDIEPTKKDKPRKDTHLASRTLENLMELITLADEDDCVAIDGALVKRMEELGFTEDDDKENDE